MRILRTIARAFSRVFTFSAPATAIALSAVIMSPMAWTLPMERAVHKFEGRAVAFVSSDPWIVGLPKPLEPVPVLYVKDDPWVVKSVPTISYRGDHYDAKPKAEADKPEQKRIDALKKKLKRSSIEPSALLAYAKAQIGKRGPQLGLPARLWCQDFINFVLRKAGLPTTGSRMARSSVGHPNFVRVAKPVPGDIVVIARGRSSVYGHVALYNGPCGRGGIKMLGGNQGGGRVTDQCVYSRSIVAFVRPKAIANDNVQVANNDPPRVKPVKAKKRVVKRYRKQVVRHAKVEKPYWWRES